MFEGSSILFVYIPVCRDEDSQADGQLRDKVGELHGIVVTAPVG